MQQKWLILIAVACGTFMATLDSSIVNVALPSITTSFNTDLSYSRWVVIAYLLSITGLLLFFGKLADVVGRKTVFNLGYVVFTFGSLLCGLSQNIQQLIIARGIQGFGASMLMANGPAIITAAFPGNERGKALGTLAMVVSAGLAVGPTVGGVLVRFFNWQSVFFVNLPFGVLGAILVYYYLPVGLGMSPADRKEVFGGVKNLTFFERMTRTMKRLRSFDWLGAFIWMVIQFGYSLAIDRENALGLSSPLQKVISFGSIGLFILFLIWEWSVKDPVLNLSLFKSKIFLAANISSLFNFIAISAITLLMPFYLQDIRQLPPHQVGLVMTAIPLTIFFVAPVSGRLSDIYGSKVLSTLGMIITCTAMGLLSLPWQGLVSFSTSKITFYLILVGLGVGLFQSPNNNAIMGAVAKKHLGVASALLATVRNFGLVTGAAVSTGLLMFFYSEQFGSKNTSVPNPEYFITALRYTFMVLAAICSVAIFTSLTHDKKDRSR